MSYWAVSKYQGNPVALPDLEDAVFCAEVRSDYIVFEAELVEVGSWRPLTTVIEDQFMTPLEHEIMADTAALLAKMQQMVGIWGSRTGDLRELIKPIHEIQRAVMAQAACRLYPDLYPLLGVDD